MSMLGMQTVIARLCVDLRFREAFLADRHGALARFDLDAAEREALKGLDMAAVREFARSLLAKRIEFLRRWFPLSFLILANELSTERLSELLDQYCLENIPNSGALGGDWVYEESHRFSAYLLEQIARHNIKTPYLADVLLFEIIKLSMLYDSDVGQSAETFAASRATALTLSCEFQEYFRPLLGKHVRFHSFHFNVAEVIAHIEDRSPDGPLAERLSWVLFCKEAHALEISTYLIDASLKDLLVLCDGRRTVDDIVSALVPCHAASGEVSAAEASEECVAILVQLYNQGVITFINEKTNNTAALLAGPAGEVSKNRGDIL